MKGPWNKNAALVRGARITIAWELLLRGQLLLRRAAVSWYLNCLPSLELVVWTVSHVSFGSAPLRPKPSEACIHHFVLQQPWGVWNLSSAVSLTMAQLLWNAVTRHPRGWGLTDTLFIRNREANHRFITFSPDKKLQAGKYPRAVQGLMGKSSAPLQP